MTLSSYTHNHMDVRLWRAFYDVGADGCIDISARDAICDTFSLAICKLEWRGFFGAPAQTYADTLRKMRPDETVIEAASDDIAHCFADASWDARENLAGHRRSCQTDGSIAGAYNALN